MMARAEYNAEKSREEELRETVRSEIRGEMRTAARKRRGLGCVGCLLFFLIVLALMVGGVAFVVARTGLVAVPVFSRFYEAPSPARLVVSKKGEPIEQLLQKQLSATARQAAHSGKLPETITITVPEENLTALLNETVHPLAAEQGIEIKQLQVAVLPSEIELFTSALLKQGAGVTVRARLAFDVKNGIPSVRVNSATLGAMPIHPAPLNALVNQYLNTQLVLASEMLTAEIGAITAIIAEDGKLSVILAPKIKN